MQINLNEINKNRFFIGVIINTIFVFVELYYGFKANSVSLLADAVHNASDVVGLGLVWFGYRMAQQQATYKYTFGFKNATIIAAFVNSLILIIAVGNLMWESVMRILAPQPVVPIIVIAIAAIGVVVNGATALLFVQGKDRDIGILSVYLNFTLDVLLSLAVVVGGLLIWWQGWYLVDPILGVIIGVTIIVSLWKLFKEAFALFFHGVPGNIMIESIIEDIGKMSEVVSYHDLHIWGISTTETALSIHLVTDSKNYSPHVVDKFTKLMKDKYEIYHCTVQLDVTGTDECNVS